MTNAWMATLASRMKAVSPARVTQMEPFQMCVIRRLVCATVQQTWRETRVTHVPVDTIVFQLVVLSVAATRMEQLMVIRHVTKKVDSVFARQKSKVEHATCA